MHNMKLSTEKNIIPKIQKYLATQPVVRAWLFGSFSRGEETPSSDLDILFVPDKTQHFSLFTLGGMYSDLKELLGLEVDLVTDGTMKKNARNRVETDKILINERCASF